MRSAREGRCEIGSLFAQWTGGMGGHEPVYGMQRRNDLGHWFLNCSKLRKGTSPQWKLHRDGAAGALVVGSFNAAAHGHDEFFH